MKVRMFFVVVLAFAAGALLTLTLSAKPRANARLSDAMRQKIEEMFPDGKIDEVSPERILMLFTEVTVKTKGMEYDLTMSDDGQILVIEHEIRPEDLPSLARAAVRSVEPQGKILEAERSRVLAELKAVPLAAPRVEYNAKFNKSGRELEVTVTEDGSVARILRKLKYED